MTLGASLEEPTGVESVVDSGSSSHRPASERGVFFCHEFKPRVQARQQWPECGCWGTRSPGEPTITPCTRLPGKIAVRRKHRPLILKKEK